MIEKFNKRLGKALSLRNMSQKELANKLGVHRDTICNYVNGKTEPFINRLAEIAIILDVNPVWLLGYDVDIEPPKK